MYAVDTSITLGALLPLSGDGWPLGYTIVGALPLAVERVNKDPSLLPGHKLTYRWRDSACNAADALRGLGSLTSDGHAIDAVIGPGCSVVPPCILDSCSAHCT